MARQIGLEPTGTPAAPGEPAGTHRPINWPAMLTIVLPLFAILASTGTAVIAFTRGDPTLPDQYHWEGERLDHDFERSQRAAQLGVMATLDLQGTAGWCKVALHLHGKAPAEVDVHLIHVSRPELDRYVRLLPSAEPGVYAARCEPLPPSHWYLELTDSSGVWSFRDEVSGGAEHLELSARPTR